MNTQRARTLIARRAAIVLGYWLLWFVGWRLAIPFEIAPRISVWWPPSGATLAFLTVFGLRFLPAAAVPQLALMYLVAPSKPLIWAAITALVCTSYGGAAAIIRRFAGSLPFNSARNACIFLIAACSAAAAVAIPGATLLVSLADARWHDLGHSSLAWWIGDLAAMSIVSPFLILTLEPLLHWVNGQPQPPAAALEPNRAPMIAAALILTVVSLAVVVIGARTTGYTWFFVLFLPALYAGYALGPRGGTATALVVALCSLGLLHTGMVQTRALDLQFFMIGTAVASLLFAIAVEDWRRVHRRLLADQAQLEQRVQARTTELAEANALLEVEVRVRREAERELVEAKEAAEASYRELEAIYRNAPIGLTLIDRNLRYQRVNDVLAELNGVSVAGHLGRTVQEVVPSIASVVVPHMRRVLDGGEVVRGVEVRGETARPPGVEMIWVADFYPLKRPNGSVQAVNIVVQDVTAERQAEEQLRHSKEVAEQASALQSRFLAAASHDLRQPAQTLSLLHSILIERIKDDASARLIGQMGNAIDVMTDTLNALLDVDGLEKGRIEPRISDFPVQVIFDRVVSEFSSQAIAKNLVLKRIECRASVRSDQRLLERLVENFVANAVKYTERGKILLGCRRRGAVLRVEVWDTGPGVQEGEQDLIFEQFYRGRTPGGGRQRGLGLGLALVRSLADILGHRVGVRSISGRGSMFFVEVPLGEARPAAVALSAPPAPAKVSSPIVLVIEDEPAVRESLKLVLGGSGYRVIAAGSGEEGVALVEQGGLSPAVVIADNNLSGMLSGAEAAVRIFGCSGKTVGLILTGEASREKLDSYTRLGFEWMQKPVKAEDLLARVRALLPALAQPPADLLAPGREAASGAEEGVDGMPTVFVVEDDEGLRSALTMVIENEGLHTRAYPTAAEFLAAYRRGRSGCVLIDIGLPGMNGLQLQQRLKADAIDLPVVIVSGRSEVGLAVQAMRDGAVDFLQKPVSDRMLIDTVRRALRRSELVSEIEAERDQVKERVNRLTPREREIMAMVATGLANKEIAARLKISQRTVENHRARVMHKMEARSLADLVRATAIAGAAMASGRAQAGALPSE